jgi:membrane protein
MTVRAFARRLAAGLGRNHVLDVAASLAYYAVLALFPMLLFVVTFAALVVPVETITEALGFAPLAMPEAAATLIGQQVARMQANEVGGAWFLFSTAVFALWGASRGISALITALDRMLEVDETRSWLRRQGLAVGVTLAIAALAIVAMGLLFVGPIAGHWIADRWGLGATFDAVWTVGRWFGAGLLAMTLFVILLRILPDRRTPIRALVPGAFVAVALWLGASKAFALYVDLAGSYDRTYGAAAGVVVFLLWLWLSNLALLVGAEVNQVRSEARRERGAGSGALDRPQRVEHQVQLSRGDLRR